MTFFLPGAFGVLLALQAPSATMTGTVRDARTDEPLDGVVIVLTDLQRMVITGVDGHYVLLDVPAGPQHLVVRRIGYATRTLHALVPSEGTLAINVSLRAQPIPLEGVEARPEVTVRGVEGPVGAGPGDRWISIAAVRNHPLLAEPDAFEALAGGEVVIRPESPSGIHVRGAAADQTAYLLDGIPVISPYHAAGVFSAWNPDALARLDLHSSLPALASPGALSGVIAAVTRPPGERLAMQASVSTTQARLTLDGPLGRGAGWLLSVRSGFPGAIAPRGEASYLRGETADALLKIEAPLFGGRIELLGYDNANEVDAGAVAGAPDAMEVPRNLFEWRGRSIGGAWTRESRASTLTVRAWHATAGADASWLLDTGASSQLASSRRDAGVAAAFEHTRGDRSTELGLRIEARRTSYRFASDTAGGAGWSADTRTPLAIASIRHARSVRGTLRIEAGATVTAAAGTVHPGPHVRLTWDASERLALSGSLTRLHQFAQSLRNAESVVGNVFPTDLWMAAGSSGVPVARSDMGVLAADFRPVAGMRLGVQLYGRGFDGLVLVAPRGGEPFSTGRFAVGAGAARGLSVDVALSRARYGALAGWAWQRVRFEDGDAAYIPDHGSAHQLESGVVFFPTPTSSVRAGATAVLGRRTTPVPGALEWESCNLLDQGCEFSGSPHYGAQLPGTATLPAYIRIDLGVRKHWHIAVAGRDASVALFGTVTNIFGRRNVLTWAADPATGERVPVELRPRAPLVAGVDWRF